MRVAAGALEELRRVAAEQDAPEIAADAAALLDRVAEGLFYVACVGQFKRGKSTLLNALIGTAVLPAGVVPVTTAITIVRYSASLQASVIFDDGRRASIDPADVIDYVAESRNPLNHKAVLSVEIGVPSELLYSGMCLVDTPGLGSTAEHNTLTTRAFLPHVDAALMVIGGDPPLSGDELSVAQEIAREAPNVIVVLNKADRLPASDVADAAAFAREALTRRSNRDVPLFIVSAFEVLHGAVARDWHPLRASLEALARDAGAHLVAAARERGERRLAGRLLQHIDNRREALRRPIAETQARLAALRGAIDGARGTLHDLGYLLTGEQHRVTREVEQRRDRFLDVAMRDAPVKLDAAIDALASGVASREQSFQAAERIAHDAIREWLPVIEPEAEALYTRTTDRFVALAHDFLLRVDAPEVRAAVEDVAIDQSFRKRRGFYFASLWALTGRPPGAVLVDLVRSSRGRRAAARRDAQLFLRRLLITNSARVANDLADRVLESRRRLEVEIRTILDRATAAAQRTMERARSAHEQGHASVASELAMLEAAELVVRRAIMPDLQPDPPIAPL